jgi:succinoglycan biosynthesis protein ExoA
MSSDSGSTAPAVSALEEGSEERVDCSILVPVLNEESYIERSVAAMRRQRFPGSLEFVFADGGSSDRTREILDELAQQDPRIRVFENPNRSVSSGLNVALAHSRGRWVARMDAHTEYPEDYAALGVERLRRGGTRWVSGPQVPTGENRVSRAVALALGSPLGRGGSRKWGTEGEDDGGGDGGEFELDSGVFAGVWERSTLLEYCGWDEGWPRNSDSEMAGRFLARGEQLICLPAMGAQYVPRGSLRGLWRQYLDYGEYRAKTAVRHPHTLRRSHLLAPALVLDTVLAAWGPRAVRIPARGGLCCYGAALAWAAFTSRGAEQRRDALLLPVVLSIMHYGHGAGFLRAVARYGPPVGALASVAGLDGIADAFTPAPEPVFNPSLSSP